MHLSRAMGITNKIQEHIVLPKLGKCCKRPHTFHISFVTLNQAKLRRAPYGAGRGW